MIRIIQALVLLLLACQVQAEIRIVDIVGREVVLQQPAQKVILGEGRFLAVLGVLGVEQPLTRVAGMMNEFRSFDPAGYSRYRQGFPEIDQIPTFGQTSEQSVSVEQAILAQPDVAIFGARGHGPGARSRHIIERLEAAGIKVVFIDFRQQPLKNTARSVEIVGQVLGLEAEAAKFAGFYRSEVARVTDRLQQHPPAERPTVFLEARVDTTQPCCISIAKGMFADLIEAAGGDNIAADLLPGSVGQLNLEHIIATAPQVYIGTAIGAGKTAESRIILGAGTSPELARRSLQQVLSRRGIDTLPAVSERRAYGLWHHFYNSPLNVYALQQIALWLHPELFSDLQPEQTLEQMLAGFGPVDLSGTYAVTLRKQ